VILDEGWRMSRCGSTDDAAGCLVAHSVKYEASCLVEGIAIIPHGEGAGADVYIDVGSSSK
jgi:predicted aconitase with swiveling domain